MTIPSASGVYCLWNKITGQIYVGSSKDLNKRIVQHFSSHCQNPYLKRSIKKYGKENFSITWLETGSDFQKIEQTLIDFVFTLKPKHRFNIARKTGGGLLGGSKQKHTQLCHNGRTAAEHFIVSLNGKTPEEHRALSTSNYKTCKPIRIFDAATKIKIGDFISINSAAILLKINQGNLNQHLNFVKNKKRKNGQLSSQRLTVFSNSLNKKVTAQFI